MRILATAIFALTCNVAAARSENSDLSRKAAEIQRQSLATLGFGLRSFGLLLQVRPNEFFRKAELVKNGDWSLLERLQRRGLIKLGSSAMPQENLAEEWVSIGLTPLGESVVAPIRAESSD